MNQCLRITLLITTAKDFMHAVIDKHAKKLKIEGTVQAIKSNEVRVIACGDKESIEKFVDLLHHEASKSEAEAIEIEPFLKEKDYRGVFRVIE